MRSSVVNPELVPVAVQVDDRAIYVRFSGGLEIETPVAEFSRLACAEPAMRERWQLNGRGYGIHWPDVDEDITVHGLIERATERRFGKISDVA